MSKMPTLQTPTAEEQTTVENKQISRRSLLSWLGKATMLGLSSELLLACAEHRSRVSTVPADTTLGSFEFPFSPYTDEHEIYDQWPVNTADLQQIEDILASWELTVDGLVENPVSFTFADLMALPRQDQVSDFHCVQGWSVLDIPWNGVHMKSIVDQVSPKAEATHITFHSFRGIYTESLPIEVALEPETLLAYGIGGATLPLDHGFPLRLIVPRMYGYKSAKWVSRIEFTDTSEEGYWVKYGYPTDATVPDARLRG